MFLVNVYPEITGGQLKLITIEKPLELPDWNLSCQQTIMADPLKIFCLFTFMPKNKVTEPYAHKLGGLVVNNDV